MRHNKHTHTLGVKKEHRSALIANLASSLILHGRIETTLAKAKALRPYVEKVITLAKKGTLHHRRQALSKLRNVKAVRVLFDEKAAEFANRAGGYTRIYKLGFQRQGDAAELALIELIPGSDEGYRKSRRKAPAKAKAAAQVEAPASEATEGNAEAAQQS
jgi:large subunit ribosomal protein L17